MSDFIVTHSGRCVDPLALRPEDVDIEDVAHSLSHLCRFTGHSKHFYSVCEHSVRVSWLSGEDALWGLLHDASEAYLCDLPRPLKYRPEFDWYREAERRVSFAVADRFGVPRGQVDSGDVHLADAILCVAELRDLMPPFHAGPDSLWAEHIAAADRLIGPIAPLDSRTAKQLFLATFKFLTGPWRGVPRQFASVPEAFTYSSSV